MRVIYIGAKGKPTEDASKAIYGMAETAELKAPRFKAIHDGKELILIEQEIGLEPKPKKK